MSGPSAYQAIVVGASAGGMTLILQLVRALPAGFSLPVIVVQHVGAEHGRFWVGHLNGQARVRVKEADEKEPILPGTVYLAPANYHLLIEQDRTFSLTVDERVNYARPSIDVLFETAAEAYGDALVGVVLSGANADGANGLAAIKRSGGLAIVQDPRTAEAAAMPLAAIQAAGPQHVLPPPGIIDLLVAIHQQNSRSGNTTTGTRRESSIRGHDRSFDQQ